MLPEKSLRRHSRSLSKLREAIRSQEFTLTGELALAPGQDADAIVEQARELKTATDAIQIPDHRHALPHPSNIAVAAHLLHNEIDPILHMNCRDRNRIALQSDILGARTLGASNFLLLRGSELPAGHRPKSTGVFDMGAIDLIATAAAISEGRVLTGGTEVAGAELFIGTVATAFDPPADWKPEKLETKADAGARFVQLQICMDADLLRSYLGRLVEARLTWRVQVLACIAVLPSAEVARKLRDVLPASIIPASVIRRLEEAGDAEQEGVNIAAELLQELSEIPGVAGANLVTPGDPETVTASVRASGLRSGAS